MKTIVQQTVIAVMALFAAALHAEEGSPYSGRIQHTTPPGGGAGSLSHMGQQLPQKEIRVGPSSEEGIGLAFLVGLEIDDEQRNAMMMTEKVEFVVNVVAVDSYNGAPPSPLKVALLASGEGSDPRWSRFGAWNKAKDFKLIGTIEHDPEPGEYRFDVTEALREAPPTSKSKPMLYFAIYSPEEDLTEENGGRHVMFSGEGETAPHIDIAE
jgi:hypothetical protein